MAMGVWGGAAASAGARMARLFYYLMEHFGGDETLAFFQNVSPIVPSQSPITVRPR